MPPRPPLTIEHLPALTDATLGPSDIFSSYEFGIVHLGLGNFHRAHQAVYTEEAVIVAGGRCKFAICGVTLRGGTEKKEQLGSQDNLYSIMEKDESKGPSSASLNSRVIRILRQVLALPHDLKDLELRFSDPSLRIISLTITEKGYCKSAEGDKVDIGLPSIKRDLENPSAPTTAPGVLVWAFNIRRHLDLGSISVVSCDNIPSNGTTTRNVVISLARAIEDRHGGYAGVCDWITKNVTFPSSMVDRMVPATTDQDRLIARGLLGYEDQMVVPCEPFRQWVIEDEFASDRPLWEKTGVQIVKDVVPFEHAKLRMLNGAHSAIAYLGLLSGFETVDQAIAHIPIRMFIERMVVEEVIPTLVEASRVINLVEYHKSLMARFRNSALKHRTLQIAMDGSQKIPQRLLASIIDRINSKMPFDCLALAVAAWLVYIRSAHGKGEQVHDPLSVNLLEIAAQEHLGGYVESMLGLQAVFPACLREDAGFRSVLLDKVTWLQESVSVALERVNT